MIEWIIQNKEWIFSGIGAAILVFILSFIFKNKTTSVKQKAGKNSNQYNAGGNINISKNDNK